MSTSLDGSALLAQIAADLTDDAPRSVLADLLIERGDPRGEFIRAQLAGRDKQAYTLQMKHLGSWLGELAEITYPHEWQFERGFPRSASLSSCTVDAANAQAGHAMFATLERFLLDGNDLPEDLLRDPIMKNVSHLGAIEKPALDKLLAWKTIPYRSLDLMFVPDEETQAALLGARAKLAALRSLTTSVYFLNQCEWIWDSWLGDQLEEVGLDHGASFRDLAAWLAFLHERKPRPRVSIKAHRCTLEVEHDGDDLVATARMSPGDLSKALVAIPPDLIARLRMTRTANKRELGVLENAARRMRATFEMVA